MTNFYTCKNPLCHKHRFIPDRIDQLFCSRYCRNQFNNQKYKIRNSVFINAAEKTKKDIELLKEYFENYGIQKLTLAEWLELEISNPLKIELDSVGRIILVFNDVCLISDSILWKEIFTLQQNIVKKRKRKLN